MRRILWLSGFVLGVIGLAAGIGNGHYEQVEGNSVTVIATLLTEQPESTAIKLTLAKTIELVVKEVAGVEERVFRWKLTE